MLKRFFHWQCDLCRKEIITEKWGFPEGWRAAKPELMSPIIHYCLDCIKKREIPECDLLPLENKKRR